MDGRVELPPGTGLLGAGYHGKAQRAGLAGEVQAARGRQARRTLRTLEEPDREVAVGPVSHVRLREVYERPRREHELVRRLLVPAVPVRRIGKRRAQVLHRALRTSGGVQFVNYLHGASLWGRARRPGTP